MDFSLKENIYVPHMAQIQSIRDETPDVRSFVLKFKGPEMVLEHKPGQFVLLSLFGFGEAAFSISSSPSLQKQIQLTIRKVGFLTNQIFALTEGDEVGLRGPYGNGFPIDKLLHKNLLYVGGGCGLAPLRNLICYVQENRSQFGDVTIFYGARSPADIVFKKDIRRWERGNDLKVMVTVDEGDAGWRGNVGVVTTLLDKVELDPKDTFAVVCGPAVMIHFTIKGLQKLGFADDHIILTLERHMKCGVGKCRHCTIGGKFVCVDGPVFTYEELKTLKEY